MSNEVPVYCLPILRQILTRGSLRAMVNNVDPNYDAYRRQNSSIKSCFGHKYVCVYEVRCRFEEYFLPDTPETTFGHETLRNLLDTFTVHGQWHGTGGEHIEKPYMHEAS